MNSLQLCPRLPKMCLNYQQEIVSFQLQLGSFLCCANAAKELEPNHTELNDTNYEQLVRVLDAMEIEVGEWTQVDFFIFLKVS